MKQLFLPVFLLLIGVNFVFSQPNVDGSIGSNEYGDHTDGKNMKNISADAVNYFVTWDAAYLYIAGQRTGGQTGYSGSFGDAIQIFLDFNNQTPVNEGAGYLTGVGYDGQSPALPFKADAMVVFENGQIRYNTSGTSGSFSDPGANGAYSASGTVIEAKIKWTSLGLSGQPTSFNFLMFSSYTTGNFARCPVENGSTKGYFYFTVPNTSTDKPFERLSFTQDDGVAYDFNVTGNPEYYNFTVNIPAWSSANDRNYNGTAVGDFNGSPNRIRVVQSFKVKNTLYVGGNSALFNQDGASNSGSTITFTGTSSAPSKLITAGRIDCNKGVIDNTTGAAQKLKMEIVTNGKLEFQNTATVKALCRLSDIKVNTGATFTTRTSQTSTGLEFQFATITNDGAIDMYESATYKNDITIRGTINADNTNRNTCIFGGTGTWELNELLIGNQNAKLKPNTTQVVTINMKGDLQIYRHLQCEDASGQLNFVFNGADGNQRIVADNNQTYDYGFSRPAVWFKHLTVNKPTGDVLLARCPEGTCAFMQSFPSGGENQNGLYVMGTLTLTQGRIITRTTGTTGITSATSTTNRAHYFGLLDNSTYSGSSDASYIDGPCIKFGNDAFIFPVGKNNQISTCGISAPSSTASHFTAEYFNYGLGSTSVDAGSTNLAAVTNKEFWDVARTGGSDAVSVSLYWDAGTLTNIAIPNEIKVVHYDGADWDDQNASIVTGATSNAGLCGGSNSTSGCITTTNSQSSFSPFTFGGPRGQTLPIELLYFRAEKVENEYSLLKWATASEQNNDFYAVERSRDGIEFSEIGRVEGAGNSTVEMRYQFKDLEPFAGVNYYRLRQVDFDGSRAFSNIASLNFEKEFDVTTYPNPASGTFSVDIYTEENDETTVEIYDALGRTIVSKNISLTSGLNVMPIDANNWARGYYFVKVSNRNETVMKKLVLE